MTRRSRTWLIVGVSMLGLAALYAGSFLITFPTTPIYGISFDPDYARYLMPDAGKGYLTALTDWQFRYVRLPAHWDGVEKEPGVFDFSDLDWYMDRARDYGVHVLLAVGQKTPRWPECHVPKWTKNLDPVAYNQAVQKYIAAVVRHYRDHAGLEMWQVENEPFLAFGKCPVMTAAELREEVTLVKDLDANHPTLVADSGELSSWRVTGRAADYFGTTVYRLVYDKYFGFMEYKYIPVLFYRLKLVLIGRDVKTAYLVELQAEPWFTRDASEETAEQITPTMDLARLKNNVAYANKIGFPRVYLWGAEWWTWMLTHESTGIPDYIKTLRKQ